MSMAILSSPGAVAQQSRIDLTQEMLAVTTAFIQSLSDSQRSSAVYDFDDEERLNWHFIPRPRNGIPLKELDQSQLQKAHALLQAFLSAEGYQKTLSIRSLESVLAEIEQNGRFVRDPDMYFITVFGDPAVGGDWALRYEGHHLAMNWTFVRGMGIASSPQFFGTNPAEVRSGPRQGVRVLAAEEDIARQLVSSLDDAQSGRAILDMAVPRDIFTAAEKQVSALDDLGVSYADLDSRQKLRLLELIEQVASAQPSTLADARLASIREQGLENIKFAWIGSTQRGDAHYYRVQGPGFLIEYDNTQNDANHVHLVWRDFTGDFGRDLIRLHYDAIAAEFGAGHRH